MAQPSRPSLSTGSALEQASIDQLVRELANRVNLRRGSALFVLQSLEFGDEGTDSYKHYFEVPREQATAAARSISQPAAFRQSSQPAALGLPLAARPIGASDKVASRQSKTPKARANLYWQTVIPEAQEKQFVLLTKEVVKQYCDFRVVSTKSDEENTRQRPTGLEFAKDISMTVRQVGEAYAKEADASVEKILSLIDFGHLMEERMPLPDGFYDWEDPSPAAINEGVPEAEHWRPLGPPTLKHYFEHVLLRYLGAKSTDDMDAFKTCAEHLYEMFLSYGWGAVLFLPKAMLDKMLEPDFYFTEYDMALKYLPQCRPLWHALMLKLSNWLYKGHELTFVDSMLQRQGRERLLLKLRRKAAHAERPESVHSLAGVSTVGGAPASTSPLDLDSDEGGDDTELLDFDRPSPIRRHNNTTMDLD